MKEIFVLGTALLEHSPLSARSQECLGKSDLILGESHRVTQARLKSIELKKTCEVFFLDNIKTQERNSLQKAMEALSKKGGRICLFSDMGMPLLFDPGKEWVLLALRMGFVLRCEAGPTSWGTACALSLWDPPFWVQGFLSQKIELRKKELQGLKSLEAHIVLMDTPYRFHSLLASCQDVLGKDQGAFLAWEIGTRNENYLWGTLQEIQKTMDQRGLHKGEFVLILKNPSLPS